ncbi:MAG: chorismate synthase [Clostridiales Family XIII bacterium]|jgi:chorismate synthase|nr:chorismate synthase [Clostridiales Family XIII bacterium]
MNSWGKNFRVEIFGESHGKAIGAIVDGVPAGTPIDEAFIVAEMHRRAPGRSEVSTPRYEADTPQILSGVKDGFATGAPIGCIISNTDTRSSDYGNFLRPGHAEWTARLKYGPYTDLAGGGHFSGRLTAPLVFAGALAKSVLAAHGIDIFARICQVGSQRDGIDLSSGELDNRIIERLRATSLKRFAAVDKFEPAFLEEIRYAFEDGDSVGGCIETVAIGALAGLGEPFFDSVESTLAALYFSVPAVKGVQFGAGFALAAARGSASNDAIYAEEGKVYTVTNRAGGILGGIASGMPIISRVAIKPTASIPKEQDTVEADSLAPVKARVRGRHDPCIVPRAVPVIEACTAIGLLDLLFANLKNGGK